jgi:glycosyltransferase involved in cell wall biosynthesis
MSRPRVLMIAEAANPEWVSVPLVGWQHYRAVAQRCDVHLVTQVRNAEAIRRAGVPESAFTTLDTEKVAAPLFRVSNALRGGAGKGWTTGIALSLASYLYFERLLWQRFGREIRGKAFDVVHRVTPLSPTIPSPIAARCARAGVPFILGPLNGGVPWPRWFDRERRREREWLSYIRGAYRLVPGYRSTLGSASAIVAGSSDTLQQIPERHRSKCVFVPENSVDPRRFSGFVSREAGSPLKLTFVGRLVPYKGADMLLEAAAPLIRARKVRVVVVGDGPEKERLAHIIRSHGIDSGASLLGWMSQEEVGRELRDSDLFVFPSIREFGGAVVLEAMALGAVPVVVEYGGPADLVTPETGFRVPIGPRESIISGVRDVLESVSFEPGCLKEMRARAHERVTRLFTWEAKAAQMERVYHWVMEREGPAPDFGFRSGVFREDAAAPMGAVA